MNSNNRASLIVAILLIGVGGIYLVLNLTGVSALQTWPIIFFALAAAFFLPAFFWPEARAGLAGLFIPGSILTVLGLIFLYNTLTQDWVVWAYAWLLIPGGVGVGLWLADTYGKWSNVVSTVGIWMMVISIGLFGLFAAIFGAPTLKLMGAAVILLAGLLILLRSFRKA